MASVSVVFVIEGEGGGEGAVLVGRLVAGEEV